MTEDRKTSPEELKGNIDGTKQDSYNALDKIIEESDIYLDNNNRQQQKDLTENNNITLVFLLLTIAGGMLASLLGILIRASVLLLAYSFHMVLVPVLFPIITGIFMIVIINKINGYDVLKIVEFKRNKKAMTVFVTAIMSCFITIIFGKYFGYEIAAVRTSMLSGYSEIFSFDVFFNFIINAPRLFNLSDFGWFLFLLVPNIFWYRSLWDKQLIKNKNV